MTVLQWRKHVPFAKTFSQKHFPGPTVFSKISIPFLLIFLNDDIWSPSVLCTDGFRDMKVAIGFFVWLFVGKNNFCEAFGSWYALEVDKLSFLFILYPISFSFSDFLRPPFPPFFSLSRSASFSFKYSSVSSSLFDASNAAETWFWSRIFDFAWCVRSWNSIFLEPNFYESSNRRNCNIISDKLSFVDVRLQISGNRK